MKKMILGVAAAAALFAVPAVASAETSFYANVGYTNFNIDDIDVNLGAITGRLGAQFNPYVGVEGEVGFGVADDDIAGINVELKHEVAAFVTLKYPVSDKFDVFARVGYANYEVEASGGGFSASESGSDAAYGVGAQAFFTENDGVRFDYTQHGDADAWAIAYVRRF